MEKEKQAVKRPTNIEESTYARTVWQVKPEIAVKIKDLLDPDYWAHVAGRMRAGDRIEAIPDDRHYFAEFLQLFPIFWSLPNDYQASTEAVKLGRPLVSMNNSQLAHSYLELAYRLTGTGRPKKKQRFSSILEILKIGERFNGTSKG